jgi:hypothetical protein
MCAIGTPRRTIGRGLRVVAMRRGSWFIRGMSRFAANNANTNNARNLGRVGV